MKYFKIILILTFTLIIFSCKNENKDDKFNENDLKIDVKKDTNKNDEKVNPEAKNRYIDDTAVIFFMPSPKERRELIKFYGMYDQYRFMDIFSHFIDLANTAKNLLSSRKIPVEITYAKRFIFPTQTDTVIYDTDLEDQLMGYILADGVNPPLVRNGVAKRNQLSNDLRNYFNLINFKIKDESEPETEKIPQDSTISNEGGK